MFCIRLSFIGERDMTGPQGLKVLDLVSIVVWSKVCCSYVVDMSRSQNALCLAVGSFVPRVEALRRLKKYLDWNVERRGENRGGEGLGP